MSRILTFDLGTSYFKVCLFDEDLQLIARHSVTVPVTAPKPGQCELPIADFQRTLKDAVAEVSRQAKGVRDVTTVCFASQANSFTLLDASDSPLLPILIWRDQRAQDVDAFLQEYAGGADFYASTGIAQLDHQFMVAKLHWLRSHAPALLERTRRVFTISDYFIWWLTGNHLAEAGLAGLTGLIDIHRLEYRPQALQLLNLQAASLPTVVRAGSDAGPLRNQLIDAWGLAPNCRLVMGCLDQYAGAIGAGITSAGGVCETTGTVLATVRCASEFDNDAGAGVFQGPAFSPGIYFQMVFSNLSAGVLERYRNRLPDHPTFEELDGLAAAVPSGAEGLKLNRHACCDDGTDWFDGRTAAHQRGHEVRAVLEAVAWELKEQVNVLCRSDSPNTIRACGGAARSPLWLDIKREIVGCSVVRVNSSEPTSLGAARLALRTKSN